MQRQSFRSLRIPAERPHAAVCELSQSFMARRPTKIKRVSLVLEDHFNLARGIERYMLQVLRALCIKISIICFLEKTIA